MTKPNPLSYQWFTQALELKSEEEIFIPVSSRIEQKALVRDIKKVILEYSAVDKVQASRIDVTGVFQDGKIWVKIFIKVTSPLVGFKKGSNGKMERIVLQDQAERIRQVKLMLDDNVPKFEIVKKMNLSPLEQETLLDIPNLNWDEDQRSG
jgi:hypothetical protein